MPVRLDNGPANGRAAIGRPPGPDSHDSHDSHVIEISEVNKVEQLGRAVPDCRRFLDLGLMDYGTAFALQKRIVDQKVDDPGRPDVILIVEHPAVFTLGRRGGRENLIVDDAFLETRGICVIETGRGGNITYHGPGQVVVYPIMDLARARIGVADFVHTLEQAMIDTCQDCGVRAGRNPKNHGIWVASQGVQKKIGSVGLAIHRNISFHGLALNVNLELGPFAWINPCGMTGVSMTSIQQERVGQKKTDGRGGSSVLERARQRLIHHMETLL